ncbi:hypothetical protein FN846DRAFT_887497 [Sphaerosporella brunnea]|uniref:Uncharacterized protein n=1 Tax=Sphaerosporella brunnea TaxID=1250544 RepID=A0A5J5F5N1_9PEZI|nr:hypothetical protein FN846DRAFT_887497 [Sphaerosporella brunnea]
MRMWVMDQLSKPRQQGQTGPMPVMMPSIGPLWLTTVTRNEDDGQRATQTMHDDDEEHIDLVADGQENETSGVGERFLHRCPTLCPTTLPATSTLCLKKIPVTIKFCIYLNARHGVRR